MTPGEAIQNAAGHLPVTKAVLVLSIHQDGECYATFSTMPLNDLKLLLRKAIHFYLKRLKGH